jgi:recombination protein RecA
MAKAKTFKDLMEAEFEEFYSKVFIDKEEDALIFSTGSPSLDVSIGVGGIPTKRFVEIAGVESSGKSTLAYSIAKNALNILSTLDKKVLYVDVEHQAPLDYIADLIQPYVIGKDFIIAKPNTAEDALKICEAGINSGEFGLVILDSIGALAPKEEKEKQLDEGSMTLIPRLLGKFLRRNVDAVRNNNISVIFINQVRDVIGSYVKALSTPGGHTFKHFISLSILLSKGQEIKVGDEVIGLNVKFVVKKNKLSPPNKSFIMPLIYGKGIDTARDLVSFAETLGVVQRRGAYYQFEGENLGQGMANTLETIENNPELLDKIKSMLYNIATPKESEEE